MKYQKGWKQAKQMKPYKPTLNDLFAKLESILRDENKALIGMTSQSIINNY